MSAPNTPTECSQVRDALAELALDTLDGRDRVAALAHVDGCGSCASELEELARAADALLGLAPQVEPPAGFELAVLSEIRSVRRHPRRVRVLAAAAVIVAFVGLGLGLGTTVFAPPPATTHPFVYTLTSNGHYRGDVVLMHQAAAWILVEIDDVAPKVWMTCTVKLSDGSTHRVGRFWSDGPDASWSARLTVPASSVRVVSILSSNGKEIAAAHLRT